MPFKVIYNKENNCLRGTVNGNFEAEHVPAYVQEVEKLAKKHKCKRFLNDFRKANVHLSVLNLYEVPDKTVAKEFNRTWKRAILVNEKDIKQMSFLETTSYNKGVPLKVFTDESEAMEWLHNDEQVDED